jgi:lysozyme family protein
MPISFEAFKDGYRTLWERMGVTSANQATAQANQILRVKDHYLPIATKTHVPWFVIGIIHVREAGNPPDFRAVLHNGERIIGTGRRTSLVPAGRGPFNNFEDAAIDALTIEHYTDINWHDGWGPEHVCWVLEKFNGFGYRRFGVPSPYLWGGTSVQQPGKYVSDGHYSPSVMDPQIGGMALLKSLMALDTSVAFDKVPDGTVSPRPAPKDQTPPPKVAPSPADPTHVEIATSILPELIKLLAGDKTGKVLQDITKAIQEATGSSDPTVAKQTVDANPSVSVDLLTKLAQIAIEATKAQHEEADRQRKDQLEALRAELQADIDDTQGARVNLLEFVKAHSPVAWAPFGVSVVVVLGFFAILALLLSPYAALADLAKNQIFNITIGALVAAFSTVVSFWLGSSVGSHLKDAADIELQANQADRTNDAIKAQSAQTTAVLKSAGQVPPPPPTPIAQAPAAQPVAAPARAANFDACLAVTLSQEGFGERDPAGATKFGVTLGALQAWRGKPVTPADLQALSKDEAREIYRTKYWNPMRCDDLPAGVDLEVFDFGVNAGIRTSVQVLQRVVGVTDDGSSGPITVATVGASDPKQLIAKYSQARLAYYQGLENFAQFGSTWTRRVQDVQQSALGMLG